MIRASLILSTLLLLGLLAGTILADQHSEVLRLRQQEQILPLEQILQHLQLKPSERLLEVEYEFEDGRHIYEIEYITSEGYILEVEVDAKTGKVLKTERE